MKLLLVGPSKLRYMSYLSFYRELLETSCDEVHILSWNRDGKPDAEIDFPAVFHVYEEYMKDYWPLRKKLPRYFGFRRYVKSILKKEKIDFVVFFQTVTGLSIADILIRQYRGRFVYDYRDVDWTNQIAPLRHISESLARASCATLVSSNGFRERLPILEKIKTVHNASISELKSAKPDTLQLSNFCPPYRLSYWGGIRKGVVDIALLDKFGNDKNFEIIFHGDALDVGSVESMKQYCVENRYDNIHFCGAYQSQDRVKFAKECDFLYNCYVRGASDPAMGNKYYDGLIFGVPQIGYCLSYMGRRIDDLGLGIALDPNDSDFIYQLISYIKNFDPVEYQQARMNEISLIIDEQAEVQENLRQILERVRDGLQG